MFWSIWEKDIFSKINSEFWIELEKKHIDMGPEWHIKKLWSRDIFIKLTPDTVAKINVTIEWWII